jgi:hypothetical protein
LHFFKKQEIIGFLDLVTILPLIFSLSKELLIAFLPAKK